MLLTYNFIEFGQSQTQGVGSMRAACGVNTDSLTVQSGRLHFGFVTQVSIFVKEKNDPVETENTEMTTKYSEIYMFTDGALLK